MSLLKSSLLYNGDATSVAFFNIESLESYFEKYDAVFKATVIKPMNFDQQFIGGGTKGTFFINFQLDPEFAVKQELAIIYTEFDLRPKALVKLQLSITGYDLLLPPDSMLPKLELAMMDNDLKLDVDSMLPSLEIAAMQTDLKLSADMPVIYTTDRIIPRPTFTIAYQIGNSLSTYHGSYSQFNYTSPPLPEFGYSLFEISCSHTHYTSEVHLNNTNWGPKLMSGRIKQILLLKMPEGLIWQWDNGTEKWMGNGENDPRDYVLNGIDNSLFQVINTALPVTFSGQNKFNGYHSNSRYRKYGYIYSQHLDDWQYEHYMLRATKGTLTYGSYILTSGHVSHLDGEVSTDPNFGATIDETGFIEFSIDKVSKVSIKKLSSTQHLYLARVDNLSNTIVMTTTKTAIDWNLSQGLYRLHLLGAGSVQITDLRVGHLDDSTLHL